MEPRTPINWTYLDKCPSCAGSGLTLSCYSGELCDCYECDGNGVVRMRDDRGRFSRKPIADDLDLWFFGFPDPSPIPIDDEGKAVCDVGDFDGSEFRL